MDHGFGDNDSWGGPTPPGTPEDVAKAAAMDGLPSLYHDFDAFVAKLAGVIRTDRERAQVLGWKRKAEAYDVIVECCERLQENGEKASPITEAMLDAVIEAKRLREQVKSGGVG